MNPLVVATVAFVCAFGGALAGMLLQRVLPKTHLSPETKEVLGRGMGLVATMTALVLGLVTASAKSAFDAQDDAIKRSAAGILLLDRVLAQYGPESREIRNGLQGLAAYRLALTWPEEAGSGPVEPPDSTDVTTTVEGLASRVRMLTPANEAQRYLQNQALEMTSRLQETRWQILGSVGSSVQKPFLAIVAFWLAIIFGSFGLYAPRNGTVIAILLVCGLSVAASLFLIVEMDDPFNGMMKVSSAPVRYVLAHLGQ